MSKDQRIVRRKERKKKMDINDLKACLDFNGKQSQNLKAPARSGLAFTPAGRNGRAIRRGSAEEIRSPAEY
jgi:hypothetical protein